MPTFAEFQKQQRANARQQAAYDEQVLHQLNGALANTPKPILKKVSQFAHQRAASGDVHGFKAFRDMLSSTLRKYKYEASVVTMVALYMLYEHMTKVTLFNQSPSSYPWDQTLGIPNTSSLASGGSVVDQVFAEAEECDASARVRSRQ